MGIRRQEIQELLLRPYLAARPRSEVRMDQHFALAMLL